jgi:DNA/RNA endonuclease G (NUC1)
MPGQTDSRGKIQSQPGIAIAGLSLVLAVILMPASKAQTVSVTHCQGECPAYESRVTANQSNIVIHHLYAAGINGETSFPDWVAYRVSKEAIGVASLLPRTWQPDRLLRFSPLEDIFQSGEDELRLSDNISRNNNPYAGSGTEVAEPEDRARLAPMTSFANTPYWSDLNNFSNMIPMPADLRLGPWLQLEQRINRLVADGNEAFVITGPLYLINSLSLSPSKANLNPSAYYKIISDETGTVAFMFPENMGRYDDVCAGVIDLDELEELAGLQFFPGGNRKPPGSKLLARLNCN